MKNYKNLTDAEKFEALKTLYVDKKLSIQKVADVYDLYPNKIRRDLKKFGIKIRTKSDAQKNALKTGTHKHPTKGTKRSAETKQKIGESVIQSWNEIDEKDLIIRKQKAKQLWESRSEHDKANMLQKANTAVRESSKKGSKLEHFLLNKLINNGYKVDFHKEHFLVNTKLQIDLFLPKLNIAIEVDGPSHFSPVWGEEVLKRNIAYDQKKSGLIMGRGYALIRVKQLKDFSNTRAEIVGNKLIEAIQLIDDENRNIEIGDSE